MEGFKAYKDGFSITFKNQITVSVQFSASHYCSNPIDGLSKTAEIAIIDSKGKFITSLYSGNDDVLGYTPTEDITDILVWAENHVDKTLEKE